MNKKAIGFMSKAVFLVWRLFLIAAIIFFTAVTIGQIFASKQDVRFEEASAAAKAIMGCAEKNAFLVNTDFKDCINLDGIYVNLSVTSFDSNLTKEQTEGNSLEVMCSATEKGLKSRNYPACFRQRYFIVLNNNGKNEKGAADLLVGISKYTENLQ